MARKRLVFYRRVQFVLKRGLKLLVLAGLALAATVGSIALPQGIPYGIAALHATAKLPIVVSAPAASAREIAQLPLLEEGMKLYQAGKFSEAATVWEQAVKMYEDIGADDFDRALALSYLSLAYQQAGNWQKAEEASANSLNLLEPHRDKTLSAAQLEIFARVLNARGRLELARGEAEAALESWKQAGEIYRNIGDEGGVTGNLLNQALALQNLGRYRQALKVLGEVEERLKKQPDPLVRATQMQSKRDILRAVGDLDRARERFKELKKHALLQSPPEKSATLLSWGNLERATGDRERVLKESSPSVTPFGCAIYTSQPEGLKNYTSAAKSYQQAAQLDVPATKLQAQLNEMSLHVTLATLYSDATKQAQQRAAAQELSSKIAAQLQELPPSSAKAYAQINLAQSLACLQRDNSEIHQLLEAAASMGNRIGDKRIEAYALGKRGGVYEMNREWENAEKFTAEALAAAQSIQAGDIAYQWQWQQGRLLKQRGENEKAIAAYEEAVQAIESFRPYLGAIAFGFPEVNAAIQFDFRDKVEPVYRELVELLLREPEPSQNNLAEARRLIQLLQIANLENFLQCSLQNTRTVSIDEIVDREGSTEAIVYPIISENRLDVILKLPQQKKLHHSASSINIRQLEASLKKLQIDYLPEPDRTKNIQEESAKFYKLLVQPFDAKLAEKGVTTLVFVLDDQLRNIPMAALYDADTQKYLIEKYAVALTPELQLRKPEELKRRNLTALFAGLTQARQNFPALRNVALQFQEVQSEVPAEGLFDEKFTRANLQDQIALNPFPVVHFATHGQFSSQAKDTFILDWNDRIDINELSNLLQRRAQSRPEPIELLVLSACETATGDKRAALGLAGVAVKAGARTTVATLWKVSADENTVTIFEQFYRELKDSTVSKAEALRRAQKELLAKEPPSAWAAYVLVGNWL